MDDRSSQFLDYFNAIETWMRDQLKAPEEEDFGSCLRKLQRKHGGVNRNINELKRFARLRNFITHNHQCHRPLLLPTQWSLDEIKRIRELLLSPPSILEFAAKPVDQCSPTDLLGTCIKKMYEGLFSQIPFHDGSQFTGLMTADTIARWLASEFIGDGKGIVGESSISEIMKFQEESDHLIFLRKNASVFDALSGFDEFLHRGKRLEAILITNSERQTEPLLGIITVYDIPKLNKAINP